MPYDARTRAAPVGPLRDHQDITVHATDDYELARGFICQAVSAGAIVYRTLQGDADITETVTAGQVIGVGGFATLLSAVRSTAGGTAVTTIRIGTL